MFRIVALHLKLHNEEHLLSGFWVGEPFVGLPVSQCREEEALINRSLQHTVKASAAQSPPAPLTHRLSVCVDALT